MYMLAKKNIGLTLLEVEKTYEYFRVSKDVIDVIEAGLSAENQDEYLSAFMRLSNAKRFFETHKDIKSAASILANIETLYSVSLTLFDRSHNTYL